MDSSTPCLGKSRLSIQRPLADGTDAMSHLATVSDTVARFPSKSNVPLICATVISSLADLSLEELSTICEEPGSPLGKDYLNNVQQFCV